MRFNTIGRSSVPTLDRLGVALACGVAALSAASAFPRVAAPKLCVFLALGTVAGLLATRARTASVPEPRSAWVALALVLFFAPTLTMAVPPGADMAMHVALARPMIHGDSILSPAWGSLEALYPRGFSGLVAIASLGLGLARAGLFVAGASYLLFCAGLALILRHAFGLRHAVALAVATALLSRVPQRFFDWGGNPNVLGFALGLVAGGLVAAVASGRVGAVLPSAAAFLLMVGAVAIHPIGALGAAFAIAGVWLVAFARRLPNLGSGAVVAGLALAGFAGAALAAKRLGPELSVRELTWILDYEHTAEAVVRGPAPLFFLGVRKGVREALGAPLTLVLSAVAAFEMRWGEGRRRVAWFVALVALFGLLLRFGPEIPVVGLLLYPARLMLLLPVGVAAFIGVALESVRGELAVRVGATSRLLAVATAVMAAVVHLRWYQRSVPIATRNDVRAIECLARTVPPGAVFAGAYGDATQWIPALAGFVARNAHPHCSLLDEIERSVSKLPSTHFFVGERVVYPPPEPRPQRLGRPLCLFGKAVAYELPGP